jgi:carbon-monoxide dehydrogenase large subunit
METRYIGTRVQRLEDPRLIAGAGTYVDDIKIPGTLFAAFARSPHAHARINRIDTGLARSSPGVEMVLTFADLPAALQKPLPTRGGKLLQDPPIFAPANKAVHYVGQIVAIIVACTRAEAEDAAALVDVDYDPLPPVVDYTKALEPGAPTAHEGAKDNLAARLKVAFGEVDKVFASAPHVFKETFHMHRGGCHAMECRGTLIAPDPATGRLDVWSSTQNPFGLRANLTRYLGRDPATIHALAPDVGGGFGPKSNTYPEDYALAASAVMLGKPVKWIEDRREHFLATHQQRDQHWELEVAASAEGRMLALRGRCLHDNGAYVPSDLTVPRSSTISFPGPYALQALSIEVSVVLTNMVPVTPVRGSGRPNVCFVLERMADRIARELRLDPADVRRRSFVGKDQFPYSTGIIGRDGKTSITYDSGDYHACLDLALGPFADFRARQAKARAEGRYIGLGIASYVEDTGRPLEGARVTVDAKGKVLVTTGAGSQGQGLKTILAQIAADALGVPLADVTVEIADTDKYHFAQGTVGSRTAVTAGSSAHVAAMEVRDKVMRAAADLLGSGNRFLEISDGVVRIADEPQRKVTLAEVAAKSGSLTATSDFNAGDQTYANGSNVCEVEVDVETGAVKILRYVVGHDCGRMLHPGMIEGQIRGGVVHGIGNALFEHMKYDESGNPLTTNYGDYLLPIATEIPRIEVLHLETLSPRNPLGIKGAGEGGTIPAAACVIAAIEDALSPFGVRIRSHPLSSEDIVNLIADAHTKAA